MKFSEQWLREWVDPPVSTQELVHQLTMAGLEVEGVSPVAAHFHGVVIGRIIDVNGHPESEHLSCCRVDVGKSQPLDIVTTASNVTPGLYTAVAPAGAVLPGDKRVESAEFKGRPSQGVLCSTEDLGLSEDKEQLLELPHDAVIGADLKEFLRLDDHTIEIAITPNRGDCLSINGIAREVAAIHGMSVTATAPRPVDADAQTTLPVELAAPEACPRYTGRVITDINPGAKTPWWLSERLRRSGIRSISPVVDVTNYVMLELGQPMHAFDLSKLNGGIRVRHAASGEEVTTLDGQDITLDERTLVIADHQRVIALAGIIGGLDSSVGESTRDLFLESAFFSPAAIAGQARHYGQQTESSYRFERGVDPQLPRRAMERATELLLEIVGGTAGPLIEACDEGHLPQAPSIALRHDFLQRAIGIEITAREVTQLLARLDMEIQETSEGWQVKSPSHRFDIRIEADLVEEVARLHGYERVPATRPRQPVQVTGQRYNQLKSHMRQLLVDRGYQETISFSFVDPALQALFSPGEEVIALKNPISEDMAVMRGSLWPGLIQALQYNANRQQQRIRLFEVAPRYLKHDKTIKEEHAVAGVAFGALLPEQWGSDKRVVDFFDVKGDLEALLTLSGAVDLYSFEAQNHPALHPGQTAAIYRRRDHRHLGWIGTLHPGVHRQLALPGSPPVLFELSLDALGALKTPVFHGSSKYPSVRRDIAVVVEEGLAADSLCSAVREAAGPLLRELHLFDVYHGEHLELGRKSIALGLTLQDFSRTLTDEEADAIINEVLGRLHRDYGATLRE